MCASAKFEDLDLLIFGLLMFSPHLRHSIGIIRLHFKQKARYNHYSLRLPQIFFLINSVWFTFCLLRQNSLKLEFLNQGGTNSSETFSKKTRLPGLSNEPRISSIALQIRKLQRFQMWWKILDHPVYIEMNLRRLTN